MRLHLAAMAAPILLGACATGDPVVRVDCGDLDVIVSQETANALLAGAGEDPISVATAVCDAFSNVDASAADRPVDVVVVTPNGAQVSGQVQASQQ